MAGRATGLLLLLAGLTSAVAVAGVPRGDTPFVQLFSERFLTKDGEEGRNESQRPPWPTLPIRGAAQVAIAPGGNWVLTRKGAVYHHQADSSLLARAASLPAGSRIVAVQQGFAAVSASAVQRMQCSNGGIDCRPTVSVTVDLGNVTASPAAFTNATGDYVIACGRLGCRCVGLRTKSAASLPIVGEPTAVAVSGKRVAVGTEAGLFISPDGESWRNIPPSSFGGAITSLAYVQNSTLWVGTAHCVNYVTETARIERLAGRQGLPMGDISEVTSLANGTPQRSGSAKNKSGAPPKAKGWPQGAFGSAARVWARRCGTGANGVTSSAIVSLLAAASSRLRRTTRPWSFYPRKGLRGCDGDE